MMHEFSVALNTSVGLGASSQRLPFTASLSGSSFDFSENAYKVPTSGRYCFACTASFKCPSGVSIGSSIKMSLTAGPSQTILRTEVYTFQVVSTGIFLLTLMLEHSGYFEANTPVYVTAISTASGTTVLGPTVPGTYPWITLFTGRSV
jgi:hypothetical protein